LYRGEVIAGDDSGKNLPSKLGVKKPKISIKDNSQEIQQYKDRIETEITDPKEKKVMEYLLKNTKSLDFNRNLAVTRQHQCKLPDILKNLKNQ